MKVGFEAIATYFPETVKKREDFKYLDSVIPNGMERIFRGPDEFRRFNGDHAAEIMGEMAAKKVLDDAKLRSLDIDFIIAGNLGGDFGIPMIGTYIHNKLGFPREVPVVNMQNCCAGFVDASNLAWNLVRAGEYKRILVVMATAFDAKGKAICVVDQSTPMGKLFGDGAGAAIVSAQNLKCEFLSYANRTFGELYFHMASELKPTEHPEFLKEPGGPMGTYLWADQWFFEWQQRDGKKFAIDGIEQALKKANLKLSDLDFVVIHQAQDIIHDVWIEGGVEAEISRDKWKETYHKYGNIGNVDVVPNIEELWQEGKLHNGSIIALFPPGGGGHTPCMILRWLS